MAVGGLTRAATDVDLAFLVGCGRSGTTWLQGLLASHPGVATSRETQLFAAYLSRVRDRWDYDARKLELDSSEYAVGLPTIVSRGEFLRFCRQFAEGVYERMLSSEPGATVFLDKTPNHLHEVAFILEVFPDARFIHIVRDPRAVVNSMLRAAEGWGSNWAPRSPIDAARRWLNAVLAYEDLTTLPAHV